MPTATRAAKSWNGEEILVRSPFGWDLPPGCTLKHIEDAFGDEGPCLCCGHDPADCICPECPVCHEQGNPKCYENTGHGNMEYNRDQRIGQCKMRIADLKSQLQDEEMALAYLEEQGES
jgi:hypothetical protein